jgi:AGCS family alanine or glycine:cation symporter
MLAWSYYGLKALTYLTGESRRVAILFNLTFCAFVVLGSSVQLGALVDLSDALVFVVAIPNILGLYLLAPVLGRDLRAYEARRKSPQH